jgi:hypothetical protein
VPKITPQLRLDIAATPGVYRDFEQNTGDGLRVTEHAAAVWTWTPKARLVLGAMYLDRRDWNLLPVGGILWTPYEDFKLDILFPQPKISHRVYFGMPNPDVEDWVYMAGEFADDIWAIRRADGVQDRLAYRDVRVIMGYEHKTYGCISGHAEVGYVFSRKIEYYNGDLPGIEPPGTFLLRGGLTY